MPKNLKDFLTNKFALAIASIVFGVLLIIMQGGAVALIVRIMGALLAAYGCVYTIVYYSKKSNDPYNKVVYAIVAVIAGIYVAIRPGSVAGAIFLIIGVYLFAEGLTRIFAGMGKKKFSFSMCYGIALAVLGLLVLFIPQLAFILAGAGLVIYGIMGLVGDKLLK